MATSSKSTTRETYSVYVIELSKKIWTDSKKFRDANPHYRGMSECLYVGMTSHTPQERYNKHKAGYRNKKGIKISAYYAQKYGLYLRPSLYADLNPMTKDVAMRMEAELASVLKRKGFAVWWN